MVIFPCEQFPTHHTGDDYDQDCCEDCACPTHMASMVFTRGFDLVTKYLTPKCPIFELIKPFIQTHILTRLCEDWDNNKVYI